MIKARSFLLPRGFLFLALVGLLCLLALRLGTKAAELTETELITHYSRLYVTQEKAAGRAPALTDCHAIASTEIWAWIEVICASKGAEKYQYLVGYWGQLLVMRRAPVAPPAPRA